MKITYIYHSCFVIEIEDCILVFDYYKGELPEFDKDKRLIFFVTHRHGDHFNPEIYKYAANRENVTYIVSKDVRRSLSFVVHVGSCGEETIFVDEDQKIYVNVDNHEVSEHNCGKRDIKIETLRSTDQGVAYIIEYGGKSIYFAGDLHWWTWSGESEQATRFSEEDYREEMEKIKGRHFDVAFVVLDPRQEERYFWGMKVFMETADADHVFPMHFWEKFQYIEMFKHEACALSYKDKIESITHEGQVFEYE